MRKELKASQTPSLPSDHSLLLHDHPSLSDHSETERRNILCGRDTERFVNIPVVLPIFGAKLPHNTVQIKVSRNGPSTYDELIEKILSATEGLFRNLFEEGDDNLPAVLHQLERWMSTTCCVYFVWDFAPQIHFTKTGYTMPGYGTSEASHLGSEEFVEYIHAAHTGRISYLFVAVEITRDEVMDTGSKELEQSQQVKNEGKRPDGKPPATLSEKGGRLTTPLQQPPLPCQTTSAQKETVVTDSKLPRTLSHEGGRSTIPLKQPPLPKQASRTASSQADAVEIGRREPAGKGNTVRPGSHGGCTNTGARASGSGGTGGSNLVDEAKVREGLILLIRCFGVVMCVLIAFICFPGVEFYLFLGLMAYLACITSIEEG